MTSLAMYQYIVAVNTPDPPQEFLDFVKHFAPNYPLFGHVYVLFHSTKFTVEQLRDLVEKTLPDEVSFYVGIAQDGVHVPSRKKTT
jgi:hypothetical protein